MHADQKIKQQMEQQNPAPSTASSSNARASTKLASALKEEASEKDLLPYMRERQKQFTTLFLELLSKIFFRSVFDAD